MHHESARSDLARLAIAAALAGAEQLRSRFGKIAPEAVDRKGPSDFVSEADRASELAIAGILQAGRPDFGFQGEESGLSTGAAGAPRWVVDPLDGTTNYLWGPPFVSISIALVADDGVRLGLVHDPLSDEMFVAERGDGAWLNGTRISGLVRPPHERVISAALPALHDFRDIDADLYLSALRRIMKSGSGIRRFGLAAMDLAYVAAGRLDGIVDDGIKLHDYAAGRCLVAEAGGIEKDFTGQPPTAGAVVAGLPEVQQWLLGHYSADARLF